jgi:hypothetical protein
VTLLGLVLALLDWSIVGFFGYHVLDRCVGGFGFGDGQGCFRKLEERRRRKLGVLLRRQSLEL